MREKSRSDLWRCEGVNDEGNYKGDEDSQSEKLDIIKNNKNHQT